ncbi:MAG: NAD(+)/NADH kinase [Archaeoglobaceae archaeon]|nr:NAD(+)/NADH kinase [Archaeoglobaceae archaeon]MCX8152201.1 NAD(+)/NADH kinase [Archaeoglobaceae archaeon]MDW8013917.1 NAD(+)/NADH kinase [Archaeoglobaceae archaeon]
MRAAIVYKDSKLTEKVSKFLRSLEVESKIFEKPSFELEDFDFVVSIGGDGTILRILQYLRREVPIFGINVGRVGILTHSSPEDFEEKLRRAVLDFEIEKFQRISCETEEGELIALNEIAVFSREVAKIMDAEIYVDGEPIESLRCDGVIVATPIGSTSYSLSAGGPIVDPHSEVIILNAVAPFKLNWRPMIFKSDRKILIKAKGLAIADGQKRVDVEEVEIKRSKYMAVFFKKNRIREVFKKFKEII